MSSEDLSNGTVNGGLEVDSMTPISKSDGAPRFRISKTPAANDVTDMLDAASKQNGNIPPSIVTPTIEKADDVVQETPASPTEKHEKHVHLYLPTDHNDTLQHNRTHTNTQTMGYLTHDAVPLSVFYRNQESMENIAGGKRPTLDQLHKGEGLEHAKKRHWVRI